MKKSFISAVLFLLMSVQAHALPLAHAKLIYHKEWRQGDISAVFTANHTKPETPAVMLRKFLAAPDADQRVYARSKILNVEMKPAGQLSRIEVEMAYAISNSTFEPQTYTVNRGVSILTKGNFDFYVIEEELEIDHGLFFNKGIFTVMYNFEKSGESHVYGDLALQNNKDTKLFDAEDWQTITVPN